MWKMIAMGLNLEEMTGYGKMIHQINNLFMENHSSIVFPLITKEWEICIQKISCREGKILKFSGHQLPRWHLNYKRHGE